MIKKVLTIAAAAGAFASAVGVIIVAIAYAIYALMREWLTPAASSAVTALVFAVVLGIAAMLLLGRNKPQKPLEEASPVERLIELARQKPLIAAGAAVVGSFLVLRNPGMVATLVMGLMAPKPDHRRR